MFGWNANTITHETAGHETGWMWCATPTNQKQSLNRLYLARNTHLTWNYSNCEIWMNYGMDRHSGMCHGTTVAFEPRCWGGTCLLYFRTTTGLGNVLSILLESNPRWMASSWFSLIRIQGVCLKRHPIGMWSYTTDYFCESEFHKLIRVIVDAALFVRDNDLTGLSNDARHRTRQARHTYILHDSTGRRRTNMLLDNLVIQRYSAMHEQVSHDKRIYNKTAWPCSNTMRCRSLDWLDNAQIIKVW